jgi:hypothetical protein
MADGFSPKKPLQVLDDATHPASNLNKTATQTTDAGSVPVDLAVQPPHADVHKATSHPLFRFIIPLVLCNTKTSIQRHCCRTEADQNVKKAVDGQSREH